jgi:hypothetical protein
VINPEELESIQKDSILKDYDTKVMESCIVKLKELNENKHVEKSLPDYAVMLFDEREHYRGRYETLFVGNLKKKQEKWSFYKVYDL